MGDQTKQSLYFNWLDSATGGRGRNQPHSRTYVMTWRDSRGIILYTSREGGIYRSVRANLIPHCLEFVVRLGCGLREPSSRRRWGVPVLSSKHSVESIGRTPIISESFIGGGVGAGGGESKELGDDTKVLTHPKPIIEI
jgi:hypothetical protein